MAISYGKKKGRGKTHFDCQRNMTPILLFFVINAARGAGKITPTYELERQIYLSMRTAVAVLQCDLDFFRFFNKNSAIPVYDLSAGRGHMGNGCIFYN